MRPVVVPGEVIASGHYRAGENTVRINNSIVAIRVGFPQTKGNVVRVIAFKGVYVPKVEDFVIGVISDVYYNMWKVDINSPYSAILPAIDVFGRKFDPTRDSTLKKMDVGTVIKARIVLFDRTQNPILTIRGDGLGVVEKGFITFVNPSKIARLIGKKGSTLQKIEQLTNSKIYVGQNGVILIETNNFETKNKIVEVIKLIEREAHVSGLTDKIVEYLKGSG